MDIIHNLTNPSLDVVSDPQFVAKVLSDYFDSRAVSYAGLMDKVSMILSVDLDSDKELSGQEVVSGVTAKALELWDAQDVGGHILTSNGYVSTLALRSAAVLDAIRSNQTLYSSETPSLEEPSLVMYDATGEATGSKFLTEVLFDMGQSNLSAVGLSSAIRAWTKGTSVSDRLSAFSDYVTGAFNDVFIKGNTTISYYKSLLTEQLSLPCFLSQVMSQTGIQELAEDSSVFIPTDAQIASYTGCSPVGPLCFDSVTSAVESVINVGAKLVSGLFNWAVGQVSGFVSKACDYVQTTLVDPEDIVSISNNPRDALIKDCAIPIQLTTATKPTLIFPTSASPWDFAPFSGTEHIGKWLLSSREWPFSYTITKPVIFQLIYGQAVLGTCTLFLEPVVITNSVMLVSSNRGIPLDQYFSAYPEPQPSLYNHTLAWSLRIEGATFTDSQFRSRVVDSDLIASIFRQPGLWSIKRHVLSIPSYPEGLNFDTYAISAHDVGDNSSKIYSAARCVDSWVTPPSLSEEDVFYQLAVSVKGMNVPCGYICDDVGASLNPSTLGGVACGFISGLTRYFAYDSSKPVPAYLALENADTIRMPIPGGRFTSDVSPTNADLYYLATGMYNGSQYLPVTFVDNDSKAVGQVGGLYLQFCLMKLTETLFPVDWDFIPYSTSAADILGEGFRIKTDEENVANANNLLVTAVTVAVVIAAAVVVGVAAKKISNAIALKKQRTNLIARNKLASGERLSWKEKRSLLRGSSSTSTAQSLVDNIFGGQSNESSYASDSIISYFDGVVRG